MLCASLESGYRTVATWGMTLRQSHFCVKLIHSYELLFISHVHRVHIC